VLARIKEDGTFDQLFPLSQIVKFGYKKFWSFDLSSATDRLPISLQVILLEPLLGYRLSRIWQSLLVDREYTLKLGKETKSYTYAVGQPMGALSS